MERDDKRWAIGAPCAIAIVLAAVLLIGLHTEPKGSLAQWSQSVGHSVWPHVWHWLRSPGRKGWATIVQLVGAVVTFGGLGIAWMRAKHGVTPLGLAKRLWAWIREHVAKILGWPRHVVIPSGSAHGAFSFDAYAIGAVRFNLRRGQSTQDQLEGLVQFVNNLSGKTIPQLELHIHNLRGDINNVRAHASDLASQTVAHLQEQIDRLQQELDTKQVLDLRWAIYGLLISVIGIALSYGT